MREDGDDVDVGFDGAMEDVEADIVTRLSGSRAPLDDDGRSSGRGFGMGSGTTRPTATVLRKTLSKG